MAGSPNLDLTLMAENVLQKEVIFNEDIIALDILVSRVVKDYTITIPGSPADGDAYIIGASPTGLWAGHAQEIAFWYGGWQFVTVPSQFEMYVLSASAFYKYSGTLWSAVAAGTPTNLTDLADVNASAPTNGQVLTWNTATSKWIAAGVATTLAALGDVLITSPANGQYLTYNSGASKWENTNAPAVPTTLSALSDYNSGAESPGYVAYWNGTQLSFENPASLIVISDLDQISDVVTTGKVTGDVLTWNGSAWGAATYVNVYSFAGMTDGPGSMSGHANQFLVVNATEDHLAYESLATLISSSGFALSSVSDVSVTEGAGIDGFVLYWNNGASKWEAKAVSTSLAALSDVSVTEGAGIDGQALYWNNSASKWEAKAFPSGTLAGLTDVSVTEGSGINGYALTWNQVAGKWEAVAFPSGTFAGDTDVSFTSLADGDLAQYNHTAGKWENVQLSTLLAATTGAASPAVYELGPFAPPTTAMLATTLNFTSASLTAEQNRGLLMSLTGAASATTYAMALHTLVLSTAPWEISCRVRTSAFGDNGAFAGLVIRRSATGKQVLVGLSDYNGSGQQAKMAYTDNSNSETGVATNTFDGQWVKIAWDGTNIVGYVSVDGLLWQTLGTVTGSTALGGTPDQVGIAMRPGSSVVTGVGALWTYYQDPDYLAPARTISGFINSVALANLTDVNLTGLADDDVLSWDTGTSKWIVGAPSGGALSTLSDVSVTEGAGIDGYSLYWNNGASKWEAKAYPAQALSGLTDVSVTEASAIDTFGLTWNNASSKWVATAPLSIGGGNPQTANYSTVLSDAGKLVQMNVASANTCTIPTNASVAYPIDTVLLVQQIGAGITTITAAGGVTIDTSAASLALVQYQLAILIKTGTNTWQCAIIGSGSGGGSSTLSGLTDVNVTEGAGINGYSLTWNNSSSKWVATNVSGGGATTLSALTDVSVTEGSGIDGYDLFWNNTDTEWEARAPLSVKGVNAQTASYTTVLADAGELVQMNVASANTCTIPPNSSVAYKINSTILVQQIGAGITTITAGAGVTINTSASSLALTQYQLAILVKTATNTWQCAIIGSGSGGGSITSATYKYEFGPLAPPGVSDLTALGSGGQFTAVTGRGTLFRATQNVNSDSICGGYIDVSGFTSPWTVTFRIVPGIASAYEYVGFGIGVGDTGGKWQVLQVQGNSSTNELQLTNMNSATSYSSNVKSLNWGQAIPTWWRIHYDGTKLYYYFSWDSLMWYGYTVTVSGGWLANVKYVIIGGDNHYESAFGIDSRYDGDYSSSYYGFLITYFDSPTNAASTRTQ